MLCFLRGLHVGAQMLPAPIMPVRSDSVVFLNRDVTNWQLLSLMVDRDVSPSPIALPQRPLDTLIKHWQEATAPRLNLVGGFGDLRPIQGYAAVATFYEAAALWLRTGSAEYIDALERTLMGGLPDAMFHSPDAMERALAAQAMIDASQLVYATDSAGLYVNFYLNTFAHIVRGDTTDIIVDQSTAMPWQGMVKLRVQSGNHRTLVTTLRLRLPEWADERPTLFINGHETDYNVQQGYAVIRRQWMRYDELYLVFNTLPRPIDVAGGQVFRCGPVVYCAQEIKSTFKPHILSAAAPDEQTGHPRYSLSSANPSDSSQVMLCPYFEVEPSSRTAVLPYFTTP